MLKSAGYFVSVNCPSLDEPNGCKRPYCPFRHPSVAPPHNISEQEISNAGASNQLAIEAVNDAIAKLKSDLARDSASMVYSDDYTPMLNESYTPEPYLSYDTQSSAADLYTPGKGTDEVIKYYPTKSKKSVLHGARGASKVPHKKHSGKKTRNIYKSSKNTGPVSDMEYDPVMNYSTMILDRKKHANSDDDSTPGTSKLGMQSDGALGTGFEMEEDVSDSEDTLRIAEDDDEEDLIINEAQDNRSVESDIFGTDSDSDAIVSPSQTSQKVPESSTKSSKDTEHHITPIPGRNIVDKQISSKATTPVIEISSEENELPETSGSTSKNKGKETKKLIATPSKKEKKLGPVKTPNKERKLSGSNKTKGATTKINTNSKRAQKLKKKRKSSESDRKREHGPVQKKMKVAKLRKHSGKDESSSSSSETVITAKDMDSTHIANFIDKDEIQNLEKELTGANTYEECLKIYHESVADDSSTKKPTKPDDDDEGELEEATYPYPPAPSSGSTSETTQQVAGKRRIAHASASTSALSNRRPVVPRKRISTPAQMMIKRMEIIQKEKAARYEEASSSSGRVAHRPSSRTSLLSKKTSGKSANLLQLEKKIQENPWYPKNDLEPTACGTATKGVARVAHHAKPTLAQNGKIIPDPPRIAVDRHSKVPSNIRQRYLTTFINECLRVLNNDHRKAYAMAQMEEGRCKERSNTKNVYLSLAASTLKKLRDMPSQEVKKQANNKPMSTNDPGSTNHNVLSKKLKVKQNSVNHKKQSTKTMSHNNLLDISTIKCKGGYTIEKKQEKTALSSASLYEKLCAYIMTPEQLDKNGYPRPSDVPGRAVFKSDPPPKPFNNTEKKICAHCGKEFILDKKGNFKREEECIHHWGRAYMTRVGRGWEKRYSCCQERIGAEGCTVGDTHVHADNKMDRSGYVKTLIKSPPPDGNAGIYSLDCEMSYTVYGLELTRVSVIDQDCKTVYDTFVKPAGRVLDYNTRWSGITEDDLINVKTTIRDVQAVFLAKFSSDTILMGHSLESDLIALRIIHETVVDTSIVFPHKRGPPYKRALRTLMSEILGIVIQNMASEGHDSTEDASACMKLMMWKVSEDEKLCSRKR